MNMNKESLIIEIKNLESQRYDKELSKHDKESNQILENLYKLLDEKLSTENQEEIIQRRKENMFEFSGQYSENDINLLFSEYFE